MKTIIAGSRCYGYEEVCRAMREYAEEVTEVVSGTARGVDQGGELWASVQGRPVKRFPADWDTYGKSAGHRRNAEMAKYADALVAIWDGKSRGTANMISEARKRGLVVFIYLPR